MKMTAEDRRWAQAVKERDLWTCQRCFKMPHRQGLHAHHIFTRGRGRTRLDVDNGVSLCYGHHRWAHSNPLEFHEWVREQLGAEVYDELRLRSNQTKASRAVS